MTDDLEGLIVKEANRQGHQPNQDAIRQAGIDLAGAAMTSQGLIHMPGRGSISPADFVRSLRNTMPAAFSPVTDDKPATTSDERRSGETLTAHMRRLIEAGRKQTRMPDDWNSVRQRYGADTTTAAHMHEIERLRAAKAK
ncbi:hypothetical protein IVB18_28045 [Bradyrhizobium sp. 186]|uniref:hypothetical protein n=1 Tax=Bradyrhizobium sp. 186 TaxID=2782654 RepID=UPI0020019EBB|nr:hypothetical protein [Bradyrhizobium sp. 186]UPK32145.1 hypothetical protein IVB18_28045 [Bradyrhizobium sp. 186]